MNCFHRVPCIFLFFLCLGSCPDCILLTAYRAINGISLSQPQSDFLRSIRYLQLKDPPGVGSDFGLLADPNGPDPDDLLLVGDENHLLAYAMWNSLGRQELADLLFPAQAQRNEPVTRSSETNAQGQVNFSQIKALK